MKTALAICALTTLLVCPVLAQNGGHLLINNDSFAANSADIDTITSSGALKLLTTVPTGGTGIGGGLFVGAHSAVAHNFKCFWVSDGGSNDIAAFQIPSLKKVQNFTNSSLNGSLSGIEMAAAGPYLITLWSGSQNLAVLKINGDCSLSIVGSPVTQPDIGQISVAANNKIVVVSYYDLGEAQAYEVQSNGSLTSIGSINFADAIPECASIGCFPVSGDATSDGQFWVWGNGSLGAPSSLSATLGATGFSNAALQEYSTSGLTAIESVWFSPAARASSGNLYLAASGFGASNPAGIIVTTFDHGSITYAGATANTSAYYAGNVAGVGRSGTGSPLVQPWSDSLANGTVQSYTVNGTTLTPVDSLKTSSSGTYLLWVTAVGK